MSFCHGFFVVFFVCERISLLPAAWYQAQRVCRGARQLGSQSWKAQPLVSHASKQLVLALVLAKTANKDAAATGCMLVLLLLRKLHSPLHTVSTTFPSPCLARWC